MTRSRRNFRPQETAAIVLQHLVDQTKAYSPLKKIYSSCDLQHKSSIATCLCVARLACTAVLLARSQYRPLAESAEHSTKFLLGLQMPDMMWPRSEPGLRDRLPWYGLRGVG